MQTLKTGFVILVLGAMFYGVYVVVNTPPPSVPQDVREALSEGEPELSVDEGGDPVEISANTSGSSASEPTGIPSNVTSTGLAPSNQSAGGAIPWGSDRGPLGAPVSAAPTNSPPNSPTSAPPPLTGDPSALAPPSRTGGEDRDSLITAASEPRRPVGLERGEPSGPINAAPDSARAPAVPGNSGIVNSPSFPTAGAAADPGSDNPSSPVGSVAETPSGPPPTVAVGPGGTAADPYIESPSGNPAAVKTAAVNAAPFSAATDSPASNRPDTTIPSVGVPTATNPDVPTADAGVANNVNAEGVRFDPKEAMIERGWNEARAEVEAGKPRQALFILSRLYADPRLTPADRRRLQDALDPLAAQVIYSQQHTLEQPFVVRRGDTLTAIAEQYQVPWQLLANINGVRDPEFLVPGTKLKVVRGPFRAEVNLADNELTLHLNQLYAGRFPITVGQDPPPMAGEFEIKGKSDGREFATGDGQVIPAGHPANPYGATFMEIGRNLALHGSATAEDAAPNAGCISLSPRDALDVAGILSVGSTVTIRR